MFIEKVDHSEERVQIRFTEDEFDLVEEHVKSLIGGPHLQHSSTLKEIAVNLENWKNNDQEGGPYQVQMSLLTYKKFRGLIAAEANKLRNRFALFNLLEQGLKEVQERPMETLEVSK